MKQEIAVRHLEEFLVALEILAKVLDDVAAGTELRPMDYYNFMVLIDRFMPEVRAVANLRLFDDPEVQIPEEIPDLRLLIEGWEQ